MGQQGTYSPGQRALTQQGYLGYTPDELSKLNWGLRFTPLVCMAGALIGLATQSAWIHFVLAGLGVAAMILPAHHPFDLLYNHGIRRLTGGPAIPANPFPRRFACLLGGLMNLGIGLSFRAGMIALAYGLGAVLIGLQLVVITSNFCLASWMLEIATRLGGRSRKRIGAEEARHLVSAGAVLLDVRSRKEFELGHLPGAWNVPVDEVSSRASELRDRAERYITYCSAGVRSYKAAKILRKAGIEEVYDLGSMERW